MTKHRYDTAYCVMWYACSCGHQERVWNSRDGIAPPYIICSSCGGNCGMVGNMPAEYAPNHKLHHGQKYFRDGTPEEAMQIADNYVTRMIVTGKNAMGEDIHVTEADRPKFKAALLKRFEPGWPCVDVHGELSEY